MELTQRELDKMAVRNFREYLRIPSVHPDVNYGKQTLYYTPNCIQVSTFEIMGSNYAGSMNVGFRMAVYCDVRFLGMGCRPNLKFKARVLKRICYRCCTSKSWQKEKPPGLP
jgi:hypothetical protein